MTVQALAWALDQFLPDKPKLVLMALANHADHTNGYCHFDATTIAREASIQVASLWRYLGALERNGYLAKDERKPGDTETRDYWLILDRDPALPWSWAAHDSEPAEPAEPVEPAEEVSAAPSESSGSAPREASAAPPAFSRARQTEARKVATAPPPDRPPGTVPVIEGSKAHTAWCRHLRDRRQVIPFIRTIMVAGQERRGFHMPTLFPPAETVDDNIEPIAV